MTIRKSIWVARPPAISFRVFCEEISAWWPGGFGGKDSKPTMECKVGGRLYERRPDGTEYEIGRLTSDQPPSLVAFSWRAPSWDVTIKVEVRFAAEGAGTRVELEHSGFELDAKTRDARANYDSGWQMILGDFERAVSSAA